MTISYENSDSEALRELGGRIARYRLNKNLTQAALATQAGVSRPTIQRIEQGKSTQTSNLIRILRAFNLLDNLDVLVPEPAISPIQQARMRGKTRRRASSSTRERAAVPTWTWGDEE